MTEIALPLIAIAWSLLALSLLTRRRKRTDTIEGMLTGKPPCATRR